MRAKNSTTFVNEDFFKIWTLESAYFMGILEADGYINEDRRFTISLKEDDKDHIYKLHSLLDTNVTIGCASWKTFKKYRFTVTSKSMIDDLQDAGLRSGKMPSIPEEMKPHWLRGLFDGDGSIFLDKQTESYKSNIVFGQEELAHEVLSYIQTQNISAGSVHKKTSSDHCWYFTLSPKNTQVLGELMQVNSDLMLKRKQDKFVALNELLKG